MKTITTTLFFLFFGNLFAQKENITSYLAQHSTKIDLTNPAFNFDEDFYSNNLFFFGFIHGSEKPQILDLGLLKNLSKNGVFNYAPEVDFSLGYFLNQYLDTGDEKILNFCCEFYKMRVPQDASIQFKNKWKNIYKYNNQLPKNKKINIVGFDKEYSKELTLTHIAFIAPKKTTGIAIIDSLYFFKTLEKSQIDIISGRPVYKSGKSWDYFFGTEKTRFYNRFIEQYKKDSLNFINLFENYGNDLKHLINQPKTYNREQIIYNNFKKIGLPIIKNGGKIYANYGYFHIQQEKINNNQPLAKLIKNNSNIKIITIIGMLTNSECLKHRKYKKTGTITIKNVEFKKAKYNGYSTSKTYDGDNIFEKINGIKILNKISKNNDCTLFKLNGEKSPFLKMMLFADFKSGRGKRKWKVEKNAYTTDYFQYIILIKNSKPNTPIEEEKTNNK